MSSGSDSDAPEDVSFSKGKSAAIENIKAARGQITQTKKQQKQKRRLLDEQYKQQKKKKLEQLAKKKLPDDFLQSLPDEILNDKEVKTKITKAEEPGNVEKANSESSEELNENSFTLDDNPWGEQEDFIPLQSAGGIQVVSIEEEAKKPQTAAQKAAEIKHKLLYRSSIPRETVAARRAQMIKKKVAKMR